MLTIANANLLAKFGTDEQIERVRRRRCWPAGSPARWRCRRRRRARRWPTSPPAPNRSDDGTYRLFGTKMWISGGEHELTENIVHLVLAKIPGGPPGTKGISLFIVPKYLVDADGSIGERNDVALAGLNHKMGYRGITNTVLNFGDGTFTPGGEPGAVGYLVGEPHRGPDLHVPHDERGAPRRRAWARWRSATPATSSRWSTRASDRRAGPSTAKDPSTPQVPIIEHADVKRMLLAQKAYVEGGLALALYCARLVDVAAQRRSPTTRRDAAALLLDILTPIAKSWPSQWCLEANSLAIQVHGGYGYTREYDVEQHYRDNRLNPIHEGTHGIQSLDLLGRKVTQRGGASLAALGEAHRPTLSAAAARGRRGRRAGCDSCDAVVAAARRRDRRRCSAPATSRPRWPTAWSTWRRSATSWSPGCGWSSRAPPTARAGDFYDGKRQAARYFFRYELPKTAPQLDLLESLDRTTLEMRDDWF